MPPGPGHLEATDGSVAGKIKLVFRDFPLRNIHPQAQKAAEAAQCALEQHKFWPYHDKLFASYKLTNGRIQKICARTGLNVEQFTSCLDSSKYAAGIDADMQATAGRRQRYPDFFVNGYPSAALLRMNGLKSWWTLRWNRPKVHSAPINKELVKDTAWISLRCVAALPR